MTSTLSQIEVLHSAIARISPRFSFRHGVVDYTYGNMSPTKNGPYSTPNPHCIAYPIVLPILHSTPQAQKERSFWEILAMRAGSHHGIVLPVQITQRTVALYVASGGGISSQCGGRTLCISPLLSESGAPIYISTKTLRLWESQPYGPQRDFQQWLSCNEGEFRYDVYEYSLSQGISYIQVAANNPHEFSVVQRFVEDGIAAMHIRAVARDRTMRLLTSVSYAKTDWDFDPAMRHKGCSYIMHAQTTVDRVKAYCRKTGWSHRLQEDQYNLSTEWLRSSYRTPMPQISSSKLEVGSMLSSMYRAKWTSEHESPLFPPAKWLAHWAIYASNGETESSIAAGVLDYLVKTMEQERLSIVGITSNLSTQHTAYVMRIIRENEAELLGRGYRLLLAPDAACNQGEGFHAIDSVFVVRNTPQED